MQARRAEQPYLAHSQDETENCSNDILGGTGTRRVRQAGKLMIGIFAGLMIMQGFDIGRPDEENHSKRSLQGVSKSSMWTHVSIDHRFHLSPSDLRLILIAIKAFLVLSLMGFGIFLYAFFRAKPRRVEHSSAQRSSSSPSLASPLEDRRNAWLTSTQTVRVPRHEMFPEWVAVNLEALHYVVRHAMGWHIFSRITGRKEEDEVARVKAWSNGIDAQLMGGDAEISGSRLILTILASGTLPTTPARLVLKALHVRILLWKASRWGIGSLWFIVDHVAARLAAHQWRLAQTFSRSSKFSDEAESLPEHLTALLQLNCNEVLTNPIIQRAYNLAWARPTNEDITQHNAEMDLVVEDSTIRSPLDALCAWLSSKTLQKALIVSLVKEDNSTFELEWDFGVALHTAPRASIAQARALAANAVFVVANRRSALSMLSQDFPSTGTPDSSQATNKGSSSALFIDSSMPEAVGYDVTLATFCALALDKIESQEIQSALLEEAVEVVSLGYQNVETLTWLSYASALRLVQALADKASLSLEKYEGLVKPIILNLESWIEDAEKREHGFEELSVDGRGSETCKAIARSKRHLIELDEKIGAFSKSYTTHEAAFSTEESPTHDVITTPADGPQSAVQIYDKTPRRNSRCSQDSGYGSDEA